MKRPRCKTCRHTMRGHKKQKCQPRFVLMYEDGSVYMGSGHNNIPSGYGTMQYANGDSYTGDFLNGKFNGCGEHQSGTSGRYVGEWHNGLRKGHGRWEGPNGEIYEGTFARDVYHGKGTLYVDNKLRYRGEWCYGTLHGDGILHTNEGEYVGQFSHDQRHGYGEQTYTEHSSTYKGKWRSDMRHGIGVYTDPTGTYSGGFSNDVKNGHGKFIANDGATYVGHWRNNKRHRRGTQMYADGGRYIGGWSRGVRTGHGHMEYANKTTYVGFWLQDQRHGRGTWTTQTVIFKGNWEDNLQVGMFVEVSRKNDSEWSSRSGHWERGNRHGVFHVVKKTSELERELWIHGERVEFQGIRAARKRACKCLKRHDAKAAEAICTFYPEIVSWNFIYRHDKQGQLIHMLEHENMLNALAKKAERLFVKGRYAFLEACMMCCTDEELEKISSDDDAGALFDSITKTFVANPWMVLHASYTDATKRKLLEGLHLGELGRCPPLDPFTRQPLDETSGSYLSEQPAEAKRIYKAFAKALLNDTPITQLAYHLKCR